MDQVRTAVGRAMSAGLVAGLTLVLVPAAPAAHGSPMEQGSKPAAGAEPLWALTDVLPLSCAQAWALAKGSESEFITMATVLGGLALNNRALKLPQTREAGLEAGKGLAADCMADPDDLLYAVVDRQVRRLGKPAKTFAK